MAMVVGGIPSFSSSSPKNSMGYWFLQTIFFFMAKLLIKYPNVYFFFMYVHYIDINAIYVIKHIITKLTGKQFYCGTNFLNTLYKRDKRISCLKM